MTQLDCSVLALRRSLNRAVVDALASCVLLMLLEVLHSVSCSREPKIGLLACIEGLSKSSWVTTTTTTKVQYQ